MSETKGTHGEPVTPRSRPWLALTLAALFFVAATPWVLRPWFLSADRLPRDTSFFATVENADLFLNTWILTWVARASVLDPSTLFDGNIFYPATNTIALSENMIAHVPITAPVFAATGSALAVLKAMALESFVLAGLAMFAFVYVPTRNVGAALVAGAAFTFAPWRVHGFPHPQYLATASIPLALLAIDLWIDRRRLYALGLLAAAIAFQILASLYLGYFILFAVVAYAGVRLFFVEAGALRAGLAMSAAVLAGTAVAAPIALPYLRARADGLLPPFEPTRFAGHAWAPWDYLSLAFVSLAGVAVLALVGGDLGQRILRRARRNPIGLRPREWALWAVVAVAVLLSTGPYIEVGSYELPTPYLFFYETVPGFSSIRGPRRFFIVVLAGLAALAGLAFARWTRHAPRSFQVGAGVAVAIGCAVAAAPAPSPVLAARLGGNAAPVYHWLAEQDAGVVLEIPSARIDGDLVGAGRNARYMLASTLHWQALLNGYSGYEPKTTSFLTPAIRGLPKPEALQLLVNAVDVRWIVVHRDRLIGDEIRAWGRPTTQGLEPAARFGPDEVYEVTLPPSPSWRERLQRTMPERDHETWAGLPTAPLAPSCRNGRITDVDMPPTIALTAFPVAIPVVIANESECGWPAVAVSETGLVGLTYAWIDPSGVARAPGPFSRLLADVPPHSTRSDPVVVIPPHGRPGRWTLEILLTQHGAIEPLDVARVPVDVAPLGP